LEWLIDEDSPEFKLRRKKVKNGEGGKLYVLTRTSVGNSQVIEESDAALSREARRADKLDEIIRFLYQHGLLDLTQREAVAQARAEDVTLAKNAVEDAWRKWGHMDAEDRDWMIRSWSCLT
jgi:hypothetical protein